MIEGKPSGTALRVAIRRAAHQLLDAPPVFEDPLALTIIGRERAAEIRANPKKYDRPRFTRYLRAFLAARHRIAEDALALGVSRGVQQYVILGAGLDTFAYRNTNAALRVFEVDAPSTQAWKRQLLKREGIAEPANLTFAPIDFEKQSLGDELAHAGLDISAPTVFAWLGVSMYLTTEATMSTLRYIASATENGGGVVFDYALPLSSVSWVQRFFARALMARVAAAGEPFQGFFDTADLISRLRALGFTEIESLSGADINRRYFAGRAGRLRVGSLGQLITAFRWPHRA